MQFVETRKILTHHAVLAMISAGIAKAEQLRQPQCLVIVDASGELLGEIRMTGARFLSRRSALAKALTAASTGAPGSNIAEGVRTAIAAATGGAVSALPGGLPIIIDGEIVGGVGVGSGTGEQDVEVAQAMLAVLT